MSGTCTIVGEFVGVRADPCGKPAGYVAVGACDRGHTRSRLLCTHHAAVFEVFPANVFCDQCDREGTETPVTYSITAAEESTR